METYRVIDSNDKLVCICATERDNDNVQEDIIDAYSKAIKLLNENPESTVLEMFESCLEDVHIIILDLETIKLPLPKPKVLLKVLLIEFMNGMDLIVSDGGYACFYRADGMVKVDLHQGRIVSPISDDDGMTVEGIVHDDCDKQYFDEIDGDVVTDDFLEKTLQWLVMGSTINDFDIIRKSIDDINYNKEINTFLNF